MQSEPPRPSSPPPAALAFACECDAASALRRRMLDAESLRAHAAEVARAHGTTRVLRWSGPVLAQFEETRQTIARAYAVLGVEGARADAVAAEEWLLDNRHVVEEQIREVQDDLPRGYLVQLPRILRGPRARFPRVYAACLDFLLHTDAHLDTDALAAYVEGYQTVAPLTIGELWAVPIMLRVGLLVVLGAAAAHVTTEMGRERASGVTQALLEHPERAPEILERADHEGVDATLVVHMWRQLREHEAAASTIQWIRDHAEKLGGSPEELAHRMHLRQAGDQLAVANAIGSMRTIATYEWSKFFERTSLVERTLSDDPGQAYPATDAASRDRYRHAVERVARRSGLDESVVAHRAIALAQGHDGGARRCVGYYLEQPGQYELERACAARLTAREAMVRATTTHPRAVYFGLLAGLSAVVLGTLRGILVPIAPARAAWLLVGLLVFAATEVALSLIGAFVVALLPPRLLSRLALDGGITPQNRTLVAVPVLFDSPATVDRLVGELEVRALANPDPDLHFALVSDFCDATHEREEGDDALVERATRRIAELNERYPLPSGLPRYALFHRKRVRNDVQGCFMGWERKRGKLEELNRLLLGTGATTFTHVVTPAALLSTVRYVITLDADTDLPRTAAMALVATIAHPLNRPVLDAGGTRVVEGYAVIQPRVGTVPSSARRSRFARTSAGPAALDPYTTAVSDVYQDLFGEASYIGKAIYDVRAFSRVHDGRIPDNRLLSHDLYEGLLARTALASDVELLDEQPPSYGIVARRAHRWIRGDWQLLSLLGRGSRRGGWSLGLLGSWKVADNLRRSLLGPASVLALLLASILWPAAAAPVAGLLALVVTAPVVLGLLSSVARRWRSRASYDGLWRDFRTTLANTALGVVLCFDQAIVAADAILRTLYRLVVSRRNLLEWQSTGLDRSGAKTPTRLWIEVPVLAALLAAVVGRHGAGWVAAPILLAWMGAPALVEWLGRPLPVVDRAARLSEVDRETLRETARKTWLFFETFVTAEEHFLPPDNFQEEPRGVVAHRTSPTNIGLYLLSTVAAYDMGFLPAHELVRRLDDTLGTLDRLDKYQGHVLNWYDTRTLAPLEPRYVSTVDSGNLAAYLWTVQRACEELAEIEPSVADDLRRIARRAVGFARAMSFGFLYDADRSLFSIGFNVSTARLDGSRYDLLASEARLASFVAIAKGDVPQKHWFHLGRARCRVDSERVLLSWSGSMFEYLMPLLVLRSYPDTLLDETHTAAVAAHRGYARRRGVPWGISEAAFNVMDLSMTYQYRAFGVPSLGLKPGLDEDLVVAPYATALAAMVDPERAARNFDALRAEGLDGQFGFYDAIDYTPARLPPNRRGVVVKTYMAHHQGMTLVAIAGVLHDAPMQRRFHDLPRVKATELLLQERVPSAAPVIDERATRAPAPAVAGEDFSLVEVVGLERQGLARVHLLGHGELATTVSSIGTGALTWRGLDVGRFREDQRLDPKGTFVYVRDPSKGQSWSTAMEPTRTQATAYGATFSVDHVELRRKDGDIETTTEIVVSPEHAVEVRRVTLTNNSSRPRTLEVTTYMEVVLAARAADVAHPAFGNLFVEMEVEESLGAVVATRRPRPGVDLQPWLVQTLVAESEGWSGTEMESSRARFLGRRGDTSSPLGLASPLGGVQRHPLDSVIALRRAVTLAPKATARLSLVTGIAPSRDEVLGLARAYGSTPPLDRVFELAWADARVELKHLGVSAAQSFRFQRLLSFVVDPYPSLRVAPPEGPTRGDGRAALWSLGVSGDLPLVVVRVDDGEVTDLCREVLLAHEFFRLNHFPMDLLLLNEEPAGYMQPLQDDLSSLVQSTFSQGHVDQRGGVFVRKASSVDPHELQLALSAARVVLRTSGGSLARQLRVAAPEPHVWDAPRAPAARTEAPSRPPLLFDNGVGGFTRDGLEYVVYGTPPAPWSNVLANPSFGSLVTEGGGGFTWAANSQQFRLSPWANDSVGDPAGELIQIEARGGQLWRATDGVARHRAGRSTFEGRTCGVHHTLSVAVDPEAPVKVSRLVLENETDGPLALRVRGYVEWVLGSTREVSRLITTTAWDASLQAAFAHNPSSLYADRRCFFRATRRPARVTCDRAVVFADYAPRAHPAGAGSPVRRPAGPVDPCAALELDLEIPAHASTTLSFVLGAGKDRAEAEQLAAEWAAEDRVASAFERADALWDDVLGAIQIETPDPALDVMVNRWLLHQVLACRLWGRSALYQSGGAFGYRDQLQDVLALLHTRPDLAREHLLRAAARQFEEGDVQHWWHPEDGAGIRTHCSDDMLWLAYATLEYVRVTGDRAVLDEHVPFLCDRPIPPDKHDVFASPRSSHEPASLYEHCIRALEAGTTEGPHGLPLMRGGDWNDGMDRVGVAGTGESVWLAWFLGGIARDFAVLATSRGDAEQATRLAATAARLSGAVEQHGWDGAWYRRGYFDDGAPLGSATSAECRIDAIAQSWSVLGGGGDGARARRAVTEAESRLVKAEPPMMLLLDPPFDGQGPDPGYIRAYPPGIRENGGQYTHGVLWTVQALAMLGEGERAYALLSKLNPVAHGATREQMLRYGVEPYVVAGDVYSSPEHAGRGGWTWYTGAAGWMYRIAVEWILGIRIEAGRLRVRPCVPASWERYAVRIRWGNALYEISVEPGEPAGVEVDGIAARDGAVDLVDDGHIHTVTVRRRRMGQLAG